METQLNANTENLISTIGILNMTSEAVDDNKNELLIDTRFGQIVTSVDKAIYFPQGMLGLPEKLHFVISEIPGKTMGGFKLLQCLNDTSLSFVVLPVALENNFIEKSDLIECCEIASIEQEDLSVLLIAAVQKAPSEAGSVDMKVTLNVRAPVLIDTKDQAAMQYVFSSNKYQIRQEI